MTPTRHLLKAGRRTLTIAAIASALAPTSATARHIAAPGPFPSPTPTHVRDSAPNHQGARLRQASAVGSGGTYATASGESISIYTSPAYVPDPALSQQWAEFFSHLPHMPGTLETLTVYFAPVEELSAICSDQADACYDGRSRTIVLSGAGLAPDGTSNTEVAAHEFGHHVARSSNNAPFSALATGPKHWATYQNICGNVRNGTLALGDEGTGYSLNPAEGFAEAYRVFAGGDASNWSIVDPFFLPDPTALTAINADITNPWDGNSEDVWGSRFARHHTRLQVRRIRVPLDGEVLADVESYGSLDVDLFLFRPGSNKPVAKATRTGHFDNLKYLACGTPKLNLVLYRYKGYGSFDYRVSTP